MKSTKRSAALRTAVAFAAITLGLAACAQAQTFTTLSSFDEANGSAPQYGSLVQGTDGNYYGTTPAGGHYGAGVFFRVTPSGELTDLYNFCSLSKCSDGKSPWAAPVLGADGNFYGTTNGGGNSEKAGTVYRMTRAGKLTTIYTFCPTSPCNDGGYPIGLMQASNGNFYGVASNYGVGNNGTIFEISRSGVFKILYSFCSQANCADGAEPRAGLMQASNGNLFGTTGSGGAYDNGIVYRITPAGEFKTIHSFCALTVCVDGATPYAGLVEDARGNFYGTTFYGGANSFGTVYEITSAGHFVLLHSFDNTDGSYPTSALIAASDGNLYGTASNSDTFGGTIFELTAAGNFTSLYGFCTTAECTGKNPYDPLLQATDGTFYGATSGGGTSNNGTIFSFPTGLRPLVETVPTAAKVGARVIVLGNDLTGSTAVSFNGTAAAFTVVSKSEITAIVPAGATSGPIVVTTSTGTLTSNPAFQILQ
jgi:uncharacterized repeat protein (TIGR03803 family)